MVNASLRFNKIEIIFYLTCILAWGQVFLPVPPCFGYGQVQFTGFCTKGYGSVDSEKDSDMLKLLAIILFLCRRQAAWMKQVAHVLQW
uniref:Uncharacterized protein n=1 Tax=Salix viminalis TaxID=40686 RepID=A0A6N2KD92_SALVM